MIKDISAISEVELNKELRIFNATKAEYPKNKCVHQLFEEQVLKTPDKTAVIACDKALPYDELNRLANRIAHGLIAKGIKSNDIVAFALPRNSYLIPVMFGILKSGAAYMPIDPDYPRDRIDYMLDDSKAKVFITESNLNEYLSDDEANPNISMTSENYCYCIYTSGTTGNPKGTLIKHRNLANFCAVTQQNSLIIAILEKAATTLAIGSVTFDIFVSEIVPSLLLGKSVVFASQEQINDIQMLSDLMIRNRVDFIHITPSRLEVFLQNKAFVSAFENIKVAMIGGEALTSNLAGKIFEYNKELIAFNGYGPTETTLGVSFGHINNSISFGHLHNDRLNELNILIDEEKSKLVSFNATKVEYPRDKCVHQLFEEQVSKTPDKTAVIACNKTLTYDELNRLANRIAHSLIAKGVKPNDIVAFALPRNSFLIPVMFGILKSGAAYMPIDSDYPRDRIEYMLEDSKAKVFITESNLNEYLSDDETNPAIKMTLDCYCYCIYTSGTTGNPKGTIIPHFCVSNFVFQNQKNNFQSSLIQNCDYIIACNSVMFDITLQEIHLPLLNGLSVILFSEQQNHDAYFTDNLLNYEKTGIIITPTKLSLFMENAAFCSAMKNFSVIMCGAESFPNSLFDEIRKYSSAKVFNGYGPTETTCGVLYALIESSNDITIGKPIANTQIYILDKYGKLVPIGVTGELCIAGDGVGAGYLNRPELTAEKFVDNPFGEGKMYKTGDLAYWREDGNIVYVGRNDFQVKIRGLRIELGEIENAICSVEGVSQAVVVVRKDESGRQLICAFYTKKTSVKLSDIKSAISAKLPKYMMPHIFTVLEEMPLTSSGKINRKGLPEVDLANFTSDAEYVAPTTDKEKALVSEIEAVLNAEKVGILDNFFDLGGDSLKAIELISKLEAKGYKTTVKAVFDSDTVKDLAEKLEQTEPETEIIEWIGDIPATDAQMRVYTAQSMHEDSTLYNVPYVFKAKKVDIEKLQKAIDEMLCRHEILRTRFENKDGTIIQIADEKAKCTVERLASDDILAFVRPFDLSKAPLIRVGVYEDTVMIDMHHIITDGSSMPVFFRELNELYMGRTLENATVPYKRFAVMPRDHRDSEKYWLDVYKDELPELTLRTDFKRGQKQSFRGGAVYDTVSDELHKQIQDFCKKQSITPYVFFMAAFNVMLSKLSGCEDIAVGMPVSGRNGKNLNTIGMFVNTVTLRSKPNGTKTVEAFLEEVKENSVAAIDRQDYPFGELVKKLGLNTSDRNPLFDVMFAYQSEQMTDIVFGDEKAEILPLPVTASKYDFTFNILPRDNDTVVMAEYCTDLYKEETIRRFIDVYRQILSQMLNGGEIKEISALLPDERQKLLFDFNATKAEYPKDKCVHQLFEEQVAKTPDKTAVIACDKTLTYDELNKLANRIAHGLIAKGIKSNDIVAFALPRNSFLIPVMFGILKSGAAYMPIDPDYPRDRIEYMLDDSKAKEFITESNLNEYLSDDETNPAIEMTSENYCYCIYTSGSTGKPKGTLLKHGNVANYCNNNNNNVVHSIIKDGYKSIVSVTTVGFDIFVTESILPLLNGLEIVFANESQANIASELNQLLLNSQADVMQTTPTKMKMLIADEAQNAYLKTLKAIVLGGEALDQALVEKLRQYTDAEIFNIYGPTETTVWSTNAHIFSDDVTIGKPIANTQIYILDKYGKLVPIGVTGELCIAGDGVGAGYLNRPELTAEKFVDNPFGEGKMYKTGDLAYWREDGNIVYVGRNDFQVKIRGLRIELGEIENAIGSVEGVSQAVVVVRKDETGRQLICAFYTEKSPVALSDIKAAISAKLPKYMMPHIFTVLEEMPLTSSGKINRKGLPEVDLADVASDTEYVKPQTELQKGIAAVMEKVLNYTPVGLNDDFFDLGGDSLKAIEFVSKAHNEGIYFNLQSVFEHPTVQKLCAYIESGDKQTFVYDEKDFDTVNAILAKNTVEDMIIPEKTEVGSILLAGATGYLGIHILADFLDHDSGIAYCIVRGKDQNDSEKRMAELLQFYFGDKYASTDRVKVYCGDLLDEHFKLSDEDYRDLLEKVDTVVNCAASVKHYGSYKYFYDMNVGNTERLIRFAKEAGAKLIHTSTLSVSGNSFGDDFDGYISKEEKHFYESSLYIGQPLDNVYARSKFEAEKLVLEAIADRLPANIMRMGNLTNRYSDGVFQQNHESNAAAKRIKAVLELGVVPDYLMDIYCEFTPIDEAASAVMTIARHFSAERTVFHINSTKVVYLDKLLEYFNALGCNLRAVDGKTFTETLRQTAKQTGTEYIFETFINDMDENDRLQYDSNIRIENEFTVKYLRQLGFEWNEIDLAYLRKYVEYFRKIGYIKP